MDNNCKTYEWKSCVDVVDGMGSDARVVNAARVSFGKHIDEQKPITEGDEKLIKFLARNGHFTPFTHCTVTFRLRMPIWMRSEWYRHTVGLTRNEISKRYVTEGTTCHLPDMLREKHPQKKQGSKDTPIEHNEEGLALMRSSMEKSMQDYEKLLSLAVAPEIARMVLPQSMMTEFYETGSIAAYARIARLRYSESAQKEIRDFAGVIIEALKEIYPVSFQALLDTATPLHPDETIFYVQDCSCERTDTGKQQEVEDQDFLRC